MTRAGAEVLRAANELWLAVQRHLNHIHNSTLRHNHLDSAVPLLSLLLFFAFHYFVQLEWKRTRKKELRTKNTYKRDG